MAIKYSKMFFVGTYSQKGPYIPNANGTGILCCAFAGDSGQIQTVHLYKGIANATYLAKSPVDDILFCANDRYDAPGEVRAFRIGSNGSLSLLSCQSAHGSSTCHVSCDPTGKRVFVSSYGDGKLTEHCFNGQTLSPASQIISYEGSGPDKQRQEQAHVHQATISPGGQWLYVCDLGSDSIRIHSLSDAPGAVQLKGCISVPAGYGPRHLVFHPKRPLVYVFCELNAHVLTYQMSTDTGLATLVANEPALPADYKGMAAGAAIKLHPSLKTLYVSNREHNSLSVFSINESGEKLRFEGSFSSRGKDPRDFAIDPDGGWLLVANQNSDNIVPFKLDPVSGLPTGEVGDPFRCGTPVCIVFE